MCRISCRSAWRGHRSMLLGGTVVLVSGVVGILTHLAWDSFTHDGWLTDAWPALTALAGPLPVYKWLQHASTVAGLMALGVWIAVWMRHTPPIPGRQSVAPSPVRAAAWVAVTGVFGGAGLVAWVWGIGRGVAP